MALRPVITTLILCYCLFGCDFSAKKGENVDENGMNSENVHQNNEGGQNANYSFAQRSYTKKQDQCEDNCTEVIIDYPFFKEQSHLNQIIEQEIKAGVGDFVMSERPNADYEALVDLFLQNHEDFKKEFPEASSPWSLSINIEVAYKHANFISLATAINAYTGGAHPMHHRKYWNVSSSGKRVDDLDFFITDKARLREVAEQQFRTLKNVSSDQKLSEVGYTFDEDQYSLSDNFGFIETGMVIYYNSYEIGPYAMGPTELIIPYSDLKEIYKYLPQL